MGYPIDNISTKPTSLSDILRDLQASSQPAVSPVTVIAHSSPPPPSSDITVSDAFIDPNTTPSAVACDPRSPLHTGEIPEPTVKTEQSSGYWHREKSHRMTSAGSVPSSLSEISPATSTSLASFKLLITTDHYALGTAFHDIHTLKSYEVTSLMEVRLNTVIIHAKPTGIGLDHQPIILQIPRNAFSVPLACRMAEWVHRRLRLPQFTIDSSS
ncbi:hypothetical protein HGRIS_012324 [Hohenbuehelia grisea]|uniref:Uncharacterized protein n=1 Tax=Hohenbuehelia grisea TaxID=104357 RepID=A0ABR3IRW4_9AGAR